jgi:hypothetical protein
MATTSCKQDSEDKKEKQLNVNKEQLDGYWEVVYAERGDSPTRLLDNTRFYFTKDSMETNLPTQEGKAAYSWSDNELIRQANDITTYTLYTLNKDSLEFSVELQGSRFNLLLEKSKRDSSK